MCIQPQSVRRQLFQTTRWPVDRLICPIWVSLPRSVKMTEGKGLFRGQSIPAKFQGHQRTLELFLQNGCQTEKFTRPLALPRIAHGRLPNKSRLTAGMATVLLSGVESRPVAHLGAESRLSIMATCIPSNGDCIFVRRDELHVSTI